MSFYSKPNLVVLVGWIQKKKKINRAEANANKKKTKSQARTDVTSISNSVFDYHAGEIWKHISM